MGEDGSITRWFGSLKAGDREAAQKLWERFSARLVALARERLKSAPKRSADEEDAVLSAFDSFCRATEEGRFPQLRDRGELWNLLVTITVRKVHDQVAYDGRKKRGGAKLVRESELGRGGSAAQGFDEIIGREPTPQLALELAEQCQRLLDLLGDADLRTVACMKMEGYTNHEIANRLDCARSTVQRKLNLIQTRWEQEIG